MALCILLSFCTGSSSLKSILGIPHCSNLVFIVYAVYIVLCGILTIVALRIVQREYRLKLKYNKGIVKSDISYDDKTMMKFICASMVTGIMSGMFGLGGITVLTSLLLHIG